MSTATSVGYRIKGIDIDRPPIGFMSNKPYTVYLLVEAIRDEPLDLRLKELWEKSFKKSIIHIEDELKNNNQPHYRTDDSSPKIEYVDKGDYGEIKIQNIFLDYIRGISEDLKGIVNTANHQVNSELSNWEQFKEKAEKINCDFFCQ